MTDFRYGRKIIPRKSWWEGEIDGTEEEKMEAAKLTQEYIYKLLDYAGKDDDLPPEEMERLRRNYAFARQGPRAFFQRFNKRGKLTSGDVLYLLTTTKASERVGKELGVDGRKVRGIRQDEYPCWKWEYDLIKRIKAIVTNDLKLNEHKLRKIFIISHQESPEILKDLYYTNSLRMAKKVRKDMLPKYKLQEYEKEGTLDIIYPIRSEDLIR